ncbi:copper homeostasis periplasmic binding protein CopC [Novosphingobium terrae]|uniref:copper homeostasis periplasmic binding protein CopC n=1 Tax=Novosphingobium terrae TaxID=2726189 RepID=UPI00197D316B|nr:copper homeostasis periplasmic binding protein CopC [Novosphingobium terrae]
MRHPLLAAALCAGLAVSGLAAPAMAHPRLVSAKPADTTTASHVTEVSVTFSEPLMAAMSGMDLVMTGMPGMDHHQPMKMTGVKTSVAPDGVTLLAKVARPLPPGTYEADWHVVSTDTHRVTGKLTFTVK